MHLHLKLRQLQLGLELDWSGMVTLHTAYVSWELKKEEKNYSVIQQEC